MSRYQQERHSFFLFKATDTEIGLCSCWTCVYMDVDMSRVFARPTELYSALIPISLHNTGCPTEYQSKKKSLPVYFQIGIMARSITVLWGGRERSDRYAQGGLWALDPEDMKLNTETRQGGEWKRGIISLYYQYGSNLSWFITWQEVNLSGEQGKKTAIHQHATRLSPSLWVDCLANWFWKRAITRSSAHNKKCFDSWPHDHL